MLSDKAVTMFNDLSLLEEDKRSQTQTEYWNFFLRYSAAERPEADPEQESKILRYPPAELLRSSWYLNKNILTVQIKADSLLPLCTLDQDTVRKEDLGLERLLSIVKGCERLEEELLNIEPLFLNPALIFFATEAKILSLPFPPGIISAGSSFEHSADPWIFSAERVEKANKSSLEHLLLWFGETYSFSEELLATLRPLCQEGNFLKLRRILSGKAEIPQKQKTLALVPAQDKDVGEKKKINTAKNVNTKQEKTKAMKKTIRENDGKTPPDEQAEKKRKTGGLFTSLRARFSNDFYETEKTADLLIDDPFFRMACLSEGLPGSKEEKLGHRAFILVDDFLIGRDSETVDFWIDAQSVSRQHARIIRRQGSFFLEDLGSRNSTLLDGKKVNKHKEYLLPDKCRLTFADKAYYFEAGS